VELINGVELFKKMRKSLGNKRNELGKEHIAHAGEDLRRVSDERHCQVFDNETSASAASLSSGLSGLISKRRPTDRALTRERVRGARQSKKKGAQAERDVEQGREFQRQIVVTLGNLQPRTGVKTVKPSRRRFGRRF